MPKLFIAGITLLCSVVMLPVASVSAHGMPHDTVSQSASIESSCVSSVEGIARWSITNPNENDATVNWQGAGSSDAYVASQGESELVTPYDATNTTPYTFSQDGQADILVQPTDNACGDTSMRDTSDDETVPTPEACVDGSIRANLAYDWSTDNDYVTVRTATGAPLCDDINLYLTNYILPSDYDDSGIFNDSSIPQQLFDSVHVVMHKGTNLADKMTIKVPDACTDYQLDLYYAPEITEVTGAGHGAQLIYGRIYPNTATDCTPTPGMGGGDVTPPVETTPPAPVVTPAVTPVAVAPAAALYDTGESTTLPVILAIFATTLALAIKFVPFKRSTI